MQKCEVCKNKFPDHLVTRFTCCEDGVDKSIKNCCPICALKKRNEVTGLNDTKFQGEHAQWMLEEAIEYLKKKGVNMP